MISEQYDIHKWLVTSEHKIYDEIYNKNMNTLSNFLYY